MRDGLHEYRAAGTLAGVTPTLCHQVYADLGYRRQWDHNVTACGTVPDLPNGVYWASRVPWSKTKRDYVFCRTARARGSPHGDVFVSVSYAAAAPSHPPARDMVRVTDYRESVVFAPAELGPAPAATPKDGVRTRVVATYFEDPGAAVPTKSLLTSVPEFVHNFVHGTVFMAPHSSEVGRA